MKRFAVLAAAIALIGCSQSSEEIDNINNTSSSHTEFKASMPECDTRTYVEDNKYLRWNAGDEITVFAGDSYNSHWQFAGEDGANSGKFNEIGEGGFVTGTPLDLTANYAIYPYDENISITEAGTVSLTLPAVQEYNHTYENSFGAGANTMMAVTKNTSDNFLAFKNLCGYLKLKLYGDDVTVKSITVKGNTCEKIAGKATVSMTYGNEPTITMADDATDTITIDCGEGVALSNDAANPTTFWFVIPEITFEDGITINVTDINDQTFSKQTTNAVPIENNLIQPMAALGVECAPAGPANNEIWYTTTDNQPINLDAQEDGINMFNQAAFKGVVQSHSYTDGKGVIKFDNPITQIGEGDQYTYGAPAIQMYATLKSMTLPDEIVDIADRSFVNLLALEELTLPSSLDLTQSTFRDISAGILFRCPSLKQIKGEYATKDGRAWIKNNTMYVFAPAELTSYTVPNGVTELGDDLFHECKNLKELLLPQGLLVIGDCAIRYCSGLERLDIPQTVHTIGECAISFCESLLELVIPKGVTRLEHDALSGNSALTSLTLPEGIVFIDSYVFDRLPRLKKIIIPSTVERIGQCFDDSAKEIYFLSATPPSGSVIFLNSNSYHHAKTRIYVPHGCGELYRAAWPTLTDIIAEVNGPNDNEIWYMTSDGLPIDISSNMFNASISSHQYINGKGVIVFSEAVTNIEESAFCNQKTLISITLPNCIKSIGAGAFAGSGLMNFIFPESLTYIGYNALGGCPISTIVCNVTGNIEIGSDVDFYHYEGIGHLPNLAKVLGTHATSDNLCLIINGHLAAFADKNRSSYTIPSSVRYIDSYVFNGCKMQSLTLHSNVSVWANAFYSANIDLITIPKGTFVSDNGFYMCYGKAYIDTETISGTSDDAYGPYECAFFSEVTIGPNVKYIGESALCASVIYCKPTTPPSCWARPFSDVTTIYVPRGHISAYKSASYWSEYANKMVEY